jgi:hypothetical protein
VHNEIIKLYLKYRSLTLVAKSFSDPEAKGAVYRLRWLLMIPSSEIIDKEHIILDIVNQLVETSNKDYNSYELSERIIGIIEFLDFYQLTNNRYIKAYLNTLVWRALRTIEVYGNDTFNHSLNTARAIYIYMWWAKTTSTILKISADNVLINYLPFVFNKDGSTIEGSTVYQLIFTDWLLDIEKYTNFFDNYHKCLLVSVRRSTTVLLNFYPNHTDLPLIGDISPDLPIDILYQRVKNKLGIASIENRTNQAITTPFTAWTILAWHKWNVFVPHTNFNKLRKITHQHENTGHISLSHINKVILLDPGRYSYSQSATSIARKNVATVGGRLFHSRVNTLLGHQLSYDPKYDYNSLSAKFCFRSNLLGQWDRTLSSDVNNFYVKDTFDQVHGLTCINWTLADERYTIQSINDYHFKVSAGDFRIIFKSNCRLRVNIIESYRTLGYASTTKAVRLEAAILCHGRGEIETRVEMV